MLFIVPVKKMKWLTLFQSGVDQSRALRNSWSCIKICVSRALLKCYVWSAVKIYFSSSKVDYKQLSQLSSTIKPQFYIVKPGTLLKTEWSFKNLNWYFKEPRSIETRSEYILKVIDEYFWFPLTFLCIDISAGTEIQCFCSSFSIFGVPICVHIDKGTTFMLR